MLQIRILVGEDVGFIDFCISISAFGRTDTRYDAQLDFQFLQLSTTDGSNTIIRRITTPPAGGDACGYRLFVYDPLPPGEKS